MSSLSMRIGKLAEQSGHQVALCFRDGAALSAAVGVAAIQELDDLAPAEIWGTSSGALIGSALAQGMDGYEIEQLVRSIDIWRLRHDLTLVRRLFGGALC